LAVRQGNADDFEQTVIDISTPDHPRYGQHLMRDELKELLRPSAEVSGEILSWLAAEGISRERIQDNGDWINLVVTVKEAERLLDTHFYYFTQLGSKVTKIRTLEYSLPAPIAAHVQMIQPTTFFGRVRPPGRTAPDRSKRNLGSYKFGYEDKCGTQNTPSRLRLLYGFNDFAAKYGIHTRVGVSGYLEEYAQFSDLETFLVRYSPEKIGANFSVVSIKGGLNKQHSPDDSIEANLDMQYVIALADNARFTYYTTAGRGELIPDLDQPNATQNSNEPYLDQLLYLLDLTDDQLPHVLTTSYGEAEQSVPVTYARSVCNLFAQLGARGVSVIFSSGDNGVGSSCQSNDGKNTTRFNPIFPASCPFVTSVGGTHCVDPELAVEFSSGGFSDIFSRPSYQEGAVNSFLATLGNRWSGLYNPRGRGFPDIAAQAVNYHVVNKGADILVLGTRFVPSRISEISPIFTPAFC
jgi:tripeptidyl-peptidase-1